MQELREDSSDELSIPGDALGLRLTLLLWMITLCSRQLSPIGGNFYKECVDLRGLWIFLDGQTLLDTNWQVILEHNDLLRRLPFPQAAWETRC